MRRDEALAQLRQHYPELIQQGVCSVALFGSTARDEATSTSDVDLLIEFARPVGLFHVVAVKTYLEQVLQCPVDLVTPAALKAALRERILQEAIHVSP